MRWRGLIALLAVVGAAVGIAVYAWPSAANMPKPRAVDTAPPHQLRVIGGPLGDVDPHDFDLSQLIPKGSHATHVWYPRHRQILVQWTDPHRYFPVGKLGRTASRGLRLWTESTSHRWQAVDIPVVHGPPGDSVDFADVTGDGRADLLFEQYPGTNHGCGPHEVFSTSRQAFTTRVFSAYMCETTLRADHGLLALDLPYYTHNDSMCCWSYTEYLRLRWNGRKFVQTSVRMQKNTFPWG